MSHESRSLRYTCRACEVEAEIGTEDVPHPVDERVHTCRQNDDARLSGPDRRLLHIVRHVQEDEPIGYALNGHEVRLLRLRQLGLLRVELTDDGYEKLASASEVDRR